VHDLYGLASLQPLDGVLGFLKADAEQLSIELDGRYLVAAAYELSQFSQPGNLSENVIE
jgi:hypothetical protein